MKEIGIEKLIELLNEWKGKSYIFYVPDGDEKVHRKETDAYGNIHTTRIKDCELISKEFDFIKRLVENDKIRLEKFPQIMEYSDYASLLMLLSISDTPIEDLISYLK